MLGPWYPRVSWDCISKSWKCSEYSLLGTNFKLNIHKHYSKGWSIENTSYGLCNSFFDKDNDYKKIYFISHKDLMRAISLELNKQGYSVNNSVISIEEAISNKTIIMDEIANSPIPRFY